VYFTVCSWAHFLIVFQKPELRVNPKYAGMHNALREANVSIFNIMGNEEDNQVSRFELDAFDNLAGNHLTWAERVAQGSSSLKDTWFSSAMMIPPMLEIISEPSLQRTWDFNKCAVLSCLRHYTDFLCLIGAWDGLSL
jgi:hypothetical protein